MSVSVVSALRRLERSVSIIRAVKAPKLQTPSRESDVIISEFKRHVQCLQTSGYVVLRHQQVFEI